MLKLFWKKGKNAKMKALQRKSGTVLEKQERTCFTWKLALAYMLNTKKLLKKEYSFKQSVQTSLLITYLCKQSGGIFLATYGFLFAKS